MPEKKPKTKTNLQQCISLQFTLPQIMPLQNDTKILEIMYPAAKMRKPKTPEKSKKKQNNFATVHFTTYYPFTNYACTKRH